MLIAISMVQANAGAKMFGNVSETSLAVSSVFRPYNRCQSYGSNTKSALVTRIWRILDVIILECDIKNVKKKKDRDILTCANIHTHTPGKHTPHQDTWTKAHLSYILDLFTLYIYIFFFLFFSKIFTVHINSRTELVLPPIFWLLLFWETERGVSLIWFRYFRVR